MIATVTPFESKVLQAIEGCIITHSMHNYTDANIALEGIQLFGEGWAGKPQYTSEATYHVQYYSLISLFLGRLRSKGLVQDEPCLDAQDYKLSYRQWSLTSAGYAWLGLPMPTA